ncbi:hypothetical protein RJ639_005000, partial [Escallonia herrerae]
FPIRVTVLGNHDYRGNVLAQLNPILTPRDGGWLCMRSYAAEVAEFFFDLGSALKESNAKWKIVVGHHTLKSAGHHGNTKELIKQLLPVIQENNVDLYINGHDHCLEHITSPNSPLQFLTSGGGSKAWRGDISWWNPNTKKFYYDGQGFMAMQITMAQVDIIFYDIFGSALHKWSTSKSLYSGI